MGIQSAYHVLTFMCVCFSVVYDCAIPRSYSFVSKIFESQYVYDICLLSLIVAFPGHTYLFLRFLNSSTG